MPYAPTIQPPYPVLPFYPSPWVPERLRLWWDILTAGLIPVGGFIMDTGNVTVPAGGTYTVSSFTLPSYLFLSVSWVVSLVNPSGSVSAQLVDVTTNTVVGSTNSSNYVSWSVEPGHVVSFQLVNSDTTSAHAARFVFYIFLSLQFPPVSSPV